jgi:hypothetical protein
MLDQKQVRTEVEVGENLVEGQPQTNSSSTRLFWDWHRIEEAGYRLERYVQDITY